RGLPLERLQDGGRGPGRAADGPDLRLVGRTGPAAHALGVRARRLSPRPAQLEPGPLRCHDRGPDGAARHRALQRAGAAPMRALRLRAGALAVTGTARAQAPAAPAADAGRSPAPAPEYRVGAGDVLDVTVFGNEDLTRTATIQTNGAVVLPLLGEVPV